MPPRAGRPSRGRVARRSLLLGVILTLAINVAPALASHLQGGFITANVTSAGQLEGTITYLERIPCASGVGSQNTQTINLISPSNQTVAKQVVLSATRCQPDSATYVGSFSYPLSTATFSSGAPDGSYIVRYNNGNRVAGIINLANSFNAFEEFRTQVRKVTGQATSAPFLGSNIATGIGIGSIYSQNLNASDADGGTLTYQTLTGGSNFGPDFDVITLSNIGQVTIPATTTAGYTAGDFYVYKVRVTDSQGDFAERDVLLRVGTSSNHAPTISGLNTSTPYEVAPGGHRVITFTAPDSDSGNVVTVSGAGLPAWAVLSQTSGNPAQATLTLDPPSNLALGSLFGMNLDATDNDSTVPLSASATIQVKLAVSAPAPTPSAPGPVTIISGPDAQTQSPNATFVLSGTSGTTIECRLDGGAWQLCTSPVSYGSLGVGTHTFDVRQTDGNGLVSAVSSETWTISAAPAVAGPRRLTAIMASRIETQERAANVGCRLTGVEIARCLVKAFVPARLLSPAARGGAKGNELVQIGAGFTYADAHTGRVAVKVKLNAAGRRAVSRVGGVRVTFKIVATPVSGAVIRTSRVARMLPTRVLVVPSSSLFDVDDSTLSAAGERYMRWVATQLRGVSGVECIGHTDDSGDPHYNFALGLRRAQVVCGWLKARKHGVKTVPSSRGETRPRASNATERGRALNRRVELRLHY